MILYPNSLIVSFFIGLYQKNQFYSTPLMKRVFDFIISLFVIVMFSPIGVLIAFAISIESRGGVFYKQKRIGLHGNKFTLLKFRSMAINADQKGKLTIGMNDSRITKVGQIIRKYKLDEFPQFINVLIGHMSIVGPRPEVEEYVNLYSDEQKAVLDVKPGITDYASLMYFKENELLSKSSNPNKTYIEEIMPDKLRINLEYIKNQSVWEDFKIIIKTFGKILKS